MFFKIIIPNFNNISYIKECLDSILNQTFQEFIIIVVDDLSTDNSDKFVEMYERQYPDKIKYIKANKKSYAGGCRNIGINTPEYNCKYIYFLDGDDYLLHNDVLKNVYELLKKENFPKIMLFDYVYDLNNNKKFKEVNINKISLISYKNDITKTHWGSSSTRFVRQDSIKQYLESGCMGGEDTFQFLSIVDDIGIENILIYHMNIFVYRRHSTNTTSTQKYFETRKICDRKLYEKLTQFKHDYVRSSILNRLKRNKFIP